jgi:hypothetical protein
MNIGFASSALTLGQVNAIVKKLGGHEGALKLLRGELIVIDPKRPNRNEKGFFYFNVESDGTSGEEWITRLLNKGFVLDEYSKRALRSSSFVPTRGVKTEVALMHPTYIEHSERTRGRICAEAKQRMFSTADLELACLIREKLSDSQIRKMDMESILVMHEPFPGTDCDTSFIAVTRAGSGLPGSGLCEFWCTSSETPYSTDTGFAFVLSREEA